VNTHPFPHLILDGWWDQGMLLKARDAFPPPDAPVWRKYDNGQEKKLASVGSPADWPMPVQRLIMHLVDVDWCEQLSEWFGIPDLIPDLWGGGMHMIPPGGRLGTHVDFNLHHQGMFRRINCLVYLNDWSPGMGGELLLGETGEVVVEPILNRTAIFATSDHSWHGHPTPTVDGFWRKSLAVYYYTTTPPEGFRNPHDTVFWED